MIEMLDFIRYLVGPISVALLLGLVIRARRSDPHRRGELRELLWPKFKSHRLWADAMLALLAATIAGGAASQWLPISPELALTAECSAAAVGVYFAIGAALVNLHLTRITSRGGCGGEPGASAMMYAAVWPIWYSRVRLHSFGTAH
jgi:hypothetical protein